MALKFCLENKAYRNYVEEKRLVFISLDYEDHLSILYHF